MRWVRAKRWAARIKLSRTTSPESSPGLLFFALTFDRALTQGESTSKIPINVPVAQRIERWPPEPKAWVRFPPGTPNARLDEPLSFPPYLRKVVLVSHNCGMI